jgi:hypothetical protein
MPVETFLSRIEAPALRLIADHWIEVRGTRLMPRWSDIDPARIAPSLPFVWSYRYDAEEDEFIGRLAGDEIVQAFGQSLRGKRMKEFMGPEAHRVFSAWQRTVVMRPALLHGKGAVYSRADRRYNGERLALPLSEDGIRGDGVLGATIFIRLADPLATEARDLEIDPESVEFFPLT